MHVDAGDETCLETLLDGGNAAVVGRQAHGTIANGGDVCVTDFAGGKVGERHGS